MFRKPCIGNCGREVLVKLGAECRKCRKKRLHAGLKRIRKVERANKSTGRAGVFIEKKKDTEMDKKADGLVVALFSVVIALCSAIYLCVVVLDWLKEGIK